MRVFITGGAGYLGTSLVCALDQRTDISKIIVYDDLSKRNLGLFLGNQKLSNKVSFVKGTILDTRKLKKYLEDIDIVYHLAAKVAKPYADEDAHQFEQVNNWGTAELTYAIEKSDVSKLIYYSSANVYGASELPITEVNIPTPNSYYGFSKFRGEKHVLRLKNKIPCYILRIGNVYGFNSGIRLQTVINKFMFEANYFNSMTIYGKGTQRRAFININRLTECVLRITDSNTSINTGIYNLVDFNRSILEVKDFITKLYPNLEMNFLNQHIDYKELIVLGNPYFQDILIDDNKRIEQDLLFLKNSFTQ